MDSGDLSKVFEEIKAREPLFHHPEFGTSRADFERMIVEDFWEIGASGRRYSRDVVLDTLEKRHAVSVVEDWTIDGCQCRALSKDVFLFTYILTDEAGVRVTRRSTIWTRASGDWKIIYHQGTMVSD
jgi:hypothetical protein